jgi:hypothetical protein
MGEMGIRRVVGVACGATIIAALMAPALLLAAPGKHPSISVQGNSSSVTTGIVGNTVTGRYTVSFHAKLRNGIVSGTLATKIYGCLTGGSFDPTCPGPDTSLHQVGYQDVEIDCLAADPATRTVWFSGRTLAAEDQRLPEQLADQEQQIIANGDEYLFGRLRDLDGDGSADVRSLFLGLARTAYPNAVTIDDSIENPWFIAPGWSAASACLDHDAAFVTADYQVINGSTNSVQWLEPDDTTPVGPPFTGSAANLSVPPAQSRYDLSGITRTLQTDGLSLILK